MAISIVCSLSKTEADGHPPDFCRYLIKDWSGRPSLGLAECCRERKREAFFLPRAQETCDCKPPSSRDEEQSFNAELGVHDSIEPNPERIERPFADPAAVTHLAHRELRGSDGNLLVGLRAAVADLKRAIEEQNVEPAKVERRPSAGEEERRSGRQADPSGHQHQRQKTLAAQRAMGREHCRKDRGLWGQVVVGCHRGHYTGTMARKTSRRVARRSARKAPRRTAQSLRQARTRTAAEVKSPVRRSAADHAAAAGALPQATNAGVNKATPALFAAADTPEKMAALGEKRVQGLIKTIGLFRTKAKNLVALSKKIVQDHGGEVPRTREALEALPGVGRKTANVVLNVAFGESTIAVDSHIFRVGNRTGLATGKTPFEVEMKLEQVVPEKYKRHAHHWLILHGRYVCVARRPLCEKCLIADLCKWPGKHALGDRQPSI